MSRNSHAAGPGWALAEEITDAVRRRFSADVLAVGAHGALAHGDGGGDTDVTLVVVTFAAGTGPHPATRRVSGRVAELVVIGAEEYLRHARTLTTDWPLAADQYLTTRPTYDPDDWYVRLRDAHLARLAEAGPAEFAALAREAWYHAHQAVGRARTLAGRYETDAALVALCDARVGAAVVDGLLTRTYFRDGADATHRTGTAGTDMLELAERLAGQAAELAKRGRPVDGTVAELFE
ncbi:MAG TPA: nucleotidyltransferase domain-containing protein [Rugosimonospora sp.]|nr:nucleotidyltransferase domain-containing protein [Rugosimonospora sp.]